MAQYQRTNLETAVEHLTSAVGNNTVFWGEFEKGDAIREALCVWQMLVGDFTHTITMDVTGDTFYPTPRQLLSIQRVLLDGIPLALSSLSELDYGVPGWEATTGTATQWGPNGVNEFFLYPKPTSGILTLEGIRETFRPLSGGDWIDLGEEELVPLLFYGQHYLTFKEGGVELDSTKGAIAELVSAGAVRNKRLAETAVYRRAMGLYKDEGGRPPRVAGDPTVGVRL